MTDVNKLAESLRAMRRNAKGAYVSARPGAFHSITMDSTRLGDLTDAADMLEKLAAEIQSLKEAAHGLSTLAGELAADLDKAKAGAVLLTADAADAVIDGMDWDLDLTEHADMRRLVRAAETAVLAANGKAVS